MCTSRKPIEAGPLEPRRGRRRRPAANEALIGPCRLELEFDAVVQAIYRAAAGLDTWEAPLAQIADASAATSVGITVFDKATGAVVFSRSAGKHPAEQSAWRPHAGLRADARLALVKPLPVGRWIAVQGFAGEGLPACDPGARALASPPGRRHVYAAKLADDDATTVVFAHHRARGNPLTAPAERRAIERLGSHVAAALLQRRTSDDADERDALASALIDRLHQPAILIDRERRILFRSERAATLLACGDPFTERAGVLHCVDAWSESSLALALRELAHPPTGAGAPSSAAAELRTLRVRGMTGAPSVATLLAVRTRGTSGGCRPRFSALVVVHQPVARSEVDPEFAASIFGLTAAEGRVAARIAAGLSVDEIAAEGRVSSATVRSQVAAIFAKTGVRRQAELVRLLLAASAYDLDIPKSGVNVRLAGATARGNQS